MTKEEKEIVKWCIGELMEDGREGRGDFMGVIGKLCRLVGWRYKAYEFLSKGGVKGTTVDKLSKKETSFKFIGSFKDGDYT